MRPFVPKTNIRKNKTYVALAKNSMLPNFKGYVHRYNPDIEMFSYWDLGTKYEILENERIDLETFEDYEKDILDYIYIHDKTYTLFEFNSFKKAKEFLKQKAMLRELID